MIYPLKTLNQLSLILKGFRKEKGLTQAAMAERLGITQQSYAHFEAYPAAASLERFFLVLRMLDVEISLDQTPPGINRPALPAVEPLPGMRTQVVKAIGPKINKVASNTGKSKTQSSAVSRAIRLAVPPRKKESW